MKGQFTYYNGKLYEVIKRKDRPITVWVLQGIDLIYPDTLINRNAGYRYYTYGRTS